MKFSFKESVPTDREVILGILNNSEEALDKLYKAYFAMVLQLILNNNGDEDDAKDVYQEAIIVLYDKVKNGDFVLTSKLKTFLYSVSRRIWLKRLAQKSRKVGKITDYEAFLEVEDVVEDFEEKEKHFDQMHASLENLGEPCKTIIRDFYMIGLSMNDICEKFGYTNADNAKTQKYKCLQRLKKLFFNTKN